MALSIKFFINTREKKKPEKNSELKKVAYFNIRDVFLLVSKIGFMISDLIHGYFVPKKRRIRKTDYSGVTADALTMT